MSGEKLKDFNQRLSQAGLPAAVLTPEDEALTDRIVDSARATEAALERNASLFGQAWAAKAFERRMQEWDGLGEVSGVEIPEDLSRLGSQPDQSALWVVVLNDRSGERVAIEHLGQYRKVAEDRLSRIHYCQARISTKCEGHIGAVAAANGLARSAEDVDSLHTL